MIASNQQFIQMHLQRIEMLHAKEIQIAAQITVQGLVQIEDQEREEFAGTKMLIVIDYIFDTT